MAGKKGGPTALQAEVNTDEEWDSMLEKEGLIVIDVYSEWCGPCLGMVGNLKKLKLEIGGDNLHLAIVKSDNIEVLKRFRNKSEPTWMFISGGKMIRIIFGGNAPKLMRAIESELKLEARIAAGDTVDRKLYEFHELMEEERRRKEELDKKLQWENEKAERDLADKLDRIKRRSLERLARELVDYNFVLFFPHIIKEPDENIKKRTCQASYKLMVQYDTVRLQPRDQLDVLLKREELPELFYDCDMLEHLPKSFVKMITKRACMATLLQHVEQRDEDAPPPEETGSEHSVSERLGHIEERLATVVYGHMDPYNPAIETVGRNYLQENEEGQVIPPLWTPLTFISKAAAMKILFPTFVEEFHVREDTLPPPSYVMIFEATRAHEVLEAAEPFIDDILHIAYFDSADPESARKVARTVYQLEKMGAAKVQESKMVMALQKTRSDPMLALAQLSPVYISHDLVTGVKECELFFPPQVVVEEEPDHWAPPKLEEMTEEGVYVDQAGNQYTQEYWEDDTTHESIIVRRLYKYPDGTEAEGFIQLTEEGEYITRLTASQMLMRQEGEEEDEAGAGEEVLDEGPGLMDLEADLEEEGDHGPE